MAESGGRGTSGRLRSPEAADGSAGQRERENPGVTASSSAPRRAPAFAARSPPFHFRVCVGVCPGWREGARGGAGARSARRAEGGGVLALGPFLSLLRRSTAARISAAVRARGLVAAAAPHQSPHTPPRAATGPSSAPPRGGGAKAPQAGEKGRGAASLGGRRGSRKRNFSLPPPARGPQPVLPSAGGDCT